ncbi:response regulator [Geothrix sp.]|jgi:adenylate cyclase|uniref:response regulator n=1 Tax=Geothrix sp. TaxID=1962974 RepID=UPI0025C39DA8|nr:response regulator [Geothrix sp.]
MITPRDILHGKLLIVDDQEANVLLLEQMLRSAGYTSISSTMDSSKVCELHLIHRYDLILLDLQMPGMDGFQVMENLKEIERDSYLPVLVITAQPAHKLRALKSGAKDFVSKPFDLAEVLLRVHNMLEVRLLHQESKRLYDRIAAEQKVSQRLLMNVLPTALAAQLAAHPEATSGTFAELVTESYAEVTVLFADILEFTKFAEGVGAEVLLGVLEDLSTRFDDPDGRSRLDEGRTIGNAYLASVGLSDAVAEHTIKASRKALSIVEAVDHFNAHSRYKLKLRIGLDLGAEVSSTVSSRKVTYDL